MARLGERLVPRLRGRGAWGNPQPGGRHATVLTCARDKHIFGDTSALSEYTAH